MVGTTNYSSESEESEEYTDESGEESVEEEEEPKLKYQRLGFSVVDILKPEAASCMAIHDKFMVYI